MPEQRHRALGYEFSREDEARAAAGELDRRFDQDELASLRVYRIRWNNNYLVEASFPEEVSNSRLEDARALLGESGRAIHPDDLDDYKKAMESGLGGLPDWIRRLFGGNER